MRVDMSHLIKYKNSIHDLKPQLFYNLDSRPKALKVHLCTLQQSTLRWKMYIAHFG
jgi:hypothetical protein